MKVCSNCRKCIDDYFFTCECAAEAELIALANREAEMLKGYRLEKMLDVNCIFESYRAIHLATNKAVKISIVNAGDKKEILEGELCRIISLTNPRILRVYEYAPLVDNEFYIVSEFSDAPTLKEKLEGEGALSERDAITITRQISEALEVLHTAGFDHHSISPENIMIVNLPDEGFSVRLQIPDFASLDVRHVVEQANGLMSAPEKFRYYAPEMFTDEVADWCADIFSAGVVFYEMLFNKSPFRALTPASIIGYEFDEDVTDPLNHDLRALIGYVLRTALQVNPEKRFSNSLAFARQMRHLESVAANVFKHSTNYPTVSDSLNRTIPDSSYGQYELPEIEKPEISFEEDERFASFMESSISDSAAPTEPAFVYDTSEITLTVRPIARVPSSGYVSEDVSEAAGFENLDSLNDLDFIDSGLPKVVEQKPGFLSRITGAKIMIPATFAVVVLLLGAGAVFTWRHFASANSEVNIAEKPLATPNDAAGTEVAGQMNADSNSSIPAPDAIPADELAQDSSPKKVIEVQNKHNSKVSQISVTNIRSNSNVRYDSSYSAPSARRNIRRKSSKPKNSVRSTQPLEMVAENIIIVIGDKGNNSVRRRESLSSNPKFPDIVISY
ncbi:MAG: serine/threonine protein kinase [Pyrinomonadaceae bacterium]